MTDTGQVPGEGLPENAGTVEQPGVSAPGAYTFLDPSGASADDDDLLLMPGAQGAWTEGQPGQAGMQGAQGPLVPAPGRPYAPAPQEAMAYPQQPSPGYEQAAGAADSTPYEHTAYPAQAAEQPVHEPGPHETSGRDSGSVDLGAVRVPGPAPAAHASPATPAAEQPGPARRPLHMGPPVPGAAAGPVRSLADRGPAGTPPHAVPTRRSGPPTTGPEYLDVPRDDSAGLPGPQLGEIPPQGATPWTPQPQPQSQQQPLLVQEQATPAPAAGAQQPAAETVVPEDPQATPATPVAEAAQAAPAAEVAQAPQAAPATQAQQAPQAHQAHQAPQAPQAAQVPQAPEAAQTPEGTPVTSAAPATPVTPAAPASGPAAEPVQEPVAAESAVAPEAAETPQAPAEPQPAAEAAQEPSAAQPAATEAAPAPAAEQAGPAEPHATPSAQTPATQPVGQFVPVEGQIPSTPHLAPTPPQALRVPQHPDELVEHSESSEAAGPEATTAAAQAPVAEASAPAPAAEPGQDEPGPVDPAQENAPAEPSAEAEAEAETEAETVVAGPTTEAAPVPEQPATAGPDEASAEAPPAEEQPAPAAVPGDSGDATPVPADEPSATVPAPRAGDAPTPVAEETEPAAGTGTEVAAATELASAPVDADDAEPVGSPAPAYDEAEREAVLRVMRERRDIRNGFRSDPIPHEVLLRVLEAAHTAPSVGHSQPWDFVVIRSAETRQTMHELAMRQREAYAKSLPKGRAKQFKELKIEAILETPVNIVVTADPTRGGRHTLGRHTQPQMAPYSSALAVENLWLAARAEGLGVGWVSFFDEREMVRTLDLPEHLEVVAYLCVGYVDEFPDEPELMSAGWSKRRPLSWVVHEETYGRRALPGEEPHDLLAETVANIRPLDAKALGEAWERQKRMTKPAGALGMLEIISAQLSGLSRMCPPPIPEPAAVAIFAGDHGVHAQGVTPWPQEVTGQMVANFLGGGAVCNAFANQVGAEVCVIDVGVAADLPATPGLLPRKVRAGTADMTTGPALTREEVKEAIEVGIDTARDLVAAGNKALLTGEMGIANTTASAALISVFTDCDPAEVTGRGTGINDETLARKTDVVRRALELHKPDPADPIGVLAAIGGLEHAAIVGLLLGGASLRTPVILDGVSAGAAALVARAIAPEVLAACIAGHRSAEPGHVAALNKLGLRPLVDLDLRLGEGTGALLALPVVQSAARAMHEVATFDSAGVTEK
ncbi:nicotinate-nucleotide--dimethylbenzimidazole phosphoribosyltransferase [Streptomyces monticola]|uniref:Nicotinate-nucleotide--dimethylbenzimidazole phosphoribosyltransferase n=1 Tax=Streptomyces monticola TaxID=2666263 RepID=A0ABW2JQ74_9ACTN